MSVIIVSFLEEESGVSAPLDLGLSLSGEITGEVKTRIVESPLSFEINLSGELNGSIETAFISQPIALGVKLSGDLTGGTQRITSINPRLKLSGELGGSVRLAIVQPPPVLDEIDEDAFSRQFYTARLLGDGVKIDIVSAIIEEPKGAIGKRISLVIAKKDRFLITPDKSYTFQTGERETWDGPVTWTTELENAELDSRSFTEAWGTNQPADNLSFSIIEPLTDKLNRFPNGNLICYDPLKTEVKIDESDKIRIDAGGYITTDVVAKNGLTIYEVFRQVRKRIGFSNIVTNIPNYEITRFDAPFSQSWNDSLKGFLGIFEILPRLKTGNVLELFDKTQPLPDDFEPRILYVKNRTDINLTMPSGANIDGFTLSYVVSNTNANFYEDRVIPKPKIKSGVFGNPRYTETIITQTFRDWKNTADPDEVLRTDLIREERAAYNNQLELTSREINTIEYDAQGKQTGGLRTIESVVPDLDNGGNGALLLTFRETQFISYTSDPKNVSRLIPDRVEKQTDGLLAVDAANPTIDLAGEEVPYKKDLIEVWRHGNLRLDMTAQFGAIKKVTETLTYLGNSQYKVDAWEDDFINGTSKPLDSTTRVGDPGLKTIGGKTKQYVILREGLTELTGRAVPPFALGEFPLNLGKPHARRRLKRIIDRKQDGTVNIIGYHKSIKKGVYFRINDRANNSFGRFLAEGVRTIFDNIDLPNQKVMTTIDISEV